MNKILLLSIFCLIVFSLSAEAKTYAFHPDKVFFANTSIQGYQILAAWNNYSAIGIVQHDSRIIDIYFDPEDRSRNLTDVVTWNLVTRVNGEWVDIPLVRQRYSARQNAPSWVWASRNATYTGGSTLNNSYLLRAGSPLKQGFFITSQQTAIYGLKFTLLNPPQIRWNATTREIAYGFLREQFGTWADTLNYTIEFERTDNLLTIVVNFGRLDPGETVDLTQSIYTITGLPYTIGDQNSWYNVSGNLTFTTASGSTPSITFNSSANYSGFTTDSKLFNITMTFIGLAGDSQIFVFSNGSRGGNNLTNVLAYGNLLDGCLQYGTSYSNLTLYNVLLNASLVRASLSAIPDANCIQIGTSVYNSGQMFYFNNSIANLTLGRGTNTGFLVAYTGNTTVIVENSTVDITGTFGANAPNIFDFGRTVSNAPSQNYFLRVFNTTINQKHVSASAVQYIVTGNLDMNSTAIFKNVIINQTFHNGTTYGTVAKLNSSTINFTNTTWNSDVFEFAAGNSSLAVVNRLWWADVKVVNQFGIPLNNVQVEIYDSFCVTGDCEAPAHLEVNTTTNSTGYIQRAELISYFLNGSQTKYYISDTNFSASLSGVQNSTTANVTGNLVGGNEIVVVLPTPAFQWQQTNFTNGSAYVNPLTIRFFANFTTLGNTQINMTFNSTNYTMVQWNATPNSITGNYNISSLPAGTYYYNFTANNSIGANTSQTFSLVIGKGTHNLNLTLNNVEADHTGEIGEPVNATSQKPQLESEGTINLLKNGTLVDTGTFFATDTMTFTDFSVTNYTACVFETANYSSICISRFAYVPFPTPTPSPSAINIVIMSFEKIFCISNYCLIKMEDGTYSVMDINSPNVRGNKIKVIAIQQ